jgi:hypothetical protein
LIFYFINLLYRDENIPKTIAGLDKKRNISGNFHPGGSIADFNCPDHTFYGNSQIKITRVSVFALKSHCCNNFSILQK